VVAIAPAWRLCVALALIRVAARPDDRPWRTLAAKNQDVNLIVDALVAGFAPRRIVRVARHGQRREAVCELPRLRHKSGFVVRCASDAPSNASMLQRKSLARPQLPRLCIVAAVPV